VRSLIIEILLLFIVAQVLGVLTGVTIFLDIAKNPYVSSFAVPPDQSADFSQGFYMVLYVLFGAAIMLLIIKYLKSDLFMMLIEFGVVSTSSSVVFYSILRFFLPYFESMALGIFFGLLLASLKYICPVFKNSAAVLASAGAGAIIGVSFGPAPLFIFLFLISIYDYLAVFKTKHMVEFANYSLKKDLSFTITSKKYIPELKRESRIDLGTGDIILPVMCEVSLLSISPFASLFVFIGAFTSLALFLFFVLKKRMVLPALPPIAIGIFTFFIIGKLLGAY